MDAKQIKITNQGSIISILTNLANKNDPAILWQHEGDIFKRVSAEAKMIKVSNDGKQVFFSPLKDMFKFHQDEIVYCLNHEKSILFKTMIYHNSAYKLMLTTPKQLVIQEMRQHPRQNLLNKDINISYHYGTSTGGNLEKFPFTSKLLDFSPGGLAFTSSLASVKQFTRGDKITVKLHNKTQTVLNAQVSYVTPMITQGKNSFRIGVAFS